MRLSAKALRLPDKGSSTRAEYNQTIHMLRQNAPKNPRRRTWADANGKMRIEAFSIKGMAHGVPLATAKEESCGSAGAFFLDVGISSTHHIARFWNLHESAVESPQAVTAPTIVQAPSKGRYLVVADAAAEAALVRLKHHVCTLRSGGTAIP